MMLIYLFWIVRFMFSSNYKKEGSQRSFNSQVKHTAYVKSLVQNACYI